MPHSTARQADPQQQDARHSQVSRPAPPDSTAERAHVRHDIPHGGDIRDDVPRSDAPQSDPEPLGPDTLMWRYFGDWRRSCLHCGPG